MSGILQTFDHSAVNVRGGLSEKFSVGPLGRICCTFNLKLVTGGGVIARSKSGVEKRIEWGSVLRGVPLLTLGVEYGEGKIVANSDQSTESHFGTNILGILHAPSYRCKPPDLGQSQDQK